MLPKSHPAEILRARHVSIEDGPFWVIGWYFLSSTQGLPSISPRPLLPQGCGSAPTGRQRGCPSWLKALEKASRAIECGLRALDCGVGVRGSFHHVLLA